jgi:hypothetical protein
MNPILRDATKLQLTPGANGSGTVHAIAEQDRELVAAEASHRVTAADAQAEAFRCWAGRHAANFWGARSLD